MPDALPVLIVVAVLAVALLAVALLAGSRPAVGRRHRRDQDAPRPSNDPPRAGDPAGPADARGAVSRHSWMLGGGGV